MTTESAIDGASILQGTQTIREKVRAGRRSRERWEALTAWQDTAVAPSNLK